MLTICTACKQVMQPADTGSPTSDTKTLEPTQTRVSTLTTTQTSTPLTTTGTFPYGPDVVHLTGIMRREIFPGPPEWESIERGDKAVTVWVLYLDSAIDVGERLSSDSLHVPEKDVTRVQLVFITQQSQTYEGYLGQPIQVSGTLTHQVTGYHFTRILMIVEKIERAE